MQNDVSEVAIKGVMPTANGCAVFLGNDEKTFVIYVDHSVGNAISMTLNGVKKERPLTHDLIGSILLGFNITLERVIINDVTDGTFFARIILHMQNELGRKIIEVDARPSDSIVLALQQKKPIYVAQKVLDLVDDMSEILERVLKQQSETEDEGDEKEEEDEGGEEGEEGGGEKEP
ncbi:MAG TPA: bifunctional nuclease family protein [Opitutaceae bacterium]|nr:bifunctional nuclease family protein [Opitutaceae bacterium]